MRLLWDPFHPEHGKNVVTSFTVQVRPVKEQDDGGEANSWRLGRLPRERSEWKFKFYKYITWSPPLIARR